MAEIGLPWGAVLMSPRLLIVMLAVFIALLPLDAGQAASLGTAFTYQGRLTQGNLPITGGATKGQVLVFKGSRWVPASLAAAGAGWLLAGNAGTSPATQFLGTTDNQALVLRANNLIGWRLVPGTCGSPPCAPNIIGGDPAN